MPELVCHRCGVRVTLEEPIPREAACAGCGQDLRCCRDCRHWDERYHNDCTETEAEPVAEKTRRNFCEYFAYSRAPYAGARPAGERAAAARARLEELFRKPKPPAGE